MQRIKNHRRRLFKRSLLFILCVLHSYTSVAQQKILTVHEAIELAVANSHSMTLLQSKIAEANSRYRQAKDQQLLPDGMVNAAFSHAEIPANHILLGSVDWQLPDRAESYTGNVTVNETLFNGGKLKYAVQSAAWMTKLSKLDLEKNRDEVILAAVELYGALYKVVKEQEVTALNIAAVDSLVAQAEAFFQHGIVTKNDVLRFKLQKSETEIILNDLHASYDIIHYNLLVLLGLPESTHILPSLLLAEAAETGSADQYFKEALLSRTELQQVKVNAYIDSLAVKSIRADALPKLLASANLNYIHTGAAFIPAAGSFIAPFSIGAKVAWNLSALWMNKNKLSASGIRWRQNNVTTAIRTDAIKTEVNACYQQYKKSLQKIKLLQEAISQATENDRMQGEKYRNNIASVTDRIDANTQLFRTMVNLEIARTDAGIAWYRLLKSTGNISK
jgi:outer membrane protein